MTVLEIGPDSIRPPVNHTLIEAALAWIDDPVGLFDDRPVSVAELWRSVMVAALGDHCDSVLLIHPDDWSRHRIDRVVAAANAVSDEVVAVPRRDWDPAGQPGTAEDAVTERGQRALRVIPVALVVAVVPLVLAVVLLAAAAIGTHPPRPAHPPAAADSQTVVEGRITVSVPGGWTTTRVNGGPGSRRLQAGPPSDPDVAVHITQAYAPESVPAGVAEVLERRIAGQPAGVFVDFRAEVAVAGRPAVTYREVRPGRVVDWSVVLVGSTIVGVGCQSPPQRSDGIRDACELVLDSVRESGTDPRR